MSPVHFDPLEIAAFAEPQFETDATLRSNPPETVNAGDRIAYEIVLRNSGDGPAEHLVVRAVPSNLAVYAPASTTLNGMALSDDLGTSQLWSQRGLVLTDVNPGIELHIHWEMLVIAPLAAGTAIDTRAVVEWDGGHSIGLAAPTLHVLSAPSLEAGTAGTPISVAALQPHVEIPPLETLAPPPPEPVMPAMPRPEMRTERVEPPAPQIEQTREAESAAGAPVLYADLSQRELAQIIRTLEKSDAGGLIPHVFAVRALLPNAIAGAPPQLAQTAQNASHAIRAPLERLFVRLHAPRLTITAKDLEDRDSRFALRELLDGIVRTPSAEPAPRPPATIRLIGAVNVESLRKRAAEFEHAPLGSVIPWIIYAHLLGERMEYAPSGHSEVLGLYRAQLLKVFGVLETLPMPEFHRVLSSSVNRTLDDALGAVLDALRAAAQYSLR
jgi:uncharacterized repeat protein (TIGR01451 family)